MSSCGKCNEAITAVPDAVSCYIASCDKLFHQRCANISRTVNNIIINHTNLLFVCDGCKILINQLSQPTKNTVAEELLAIKTSLATITSAFARTSLVWPAISDRSGGSNTKRTRLESEMDDDPPTLSTLPINVMRMW